MLDMLTFVGLGKMPAAAPPGMERNEKPPMAASPDMMDKKNWAVAAPLAKDYLEELQTAVPPKSAPPANDGMEELPEAAPSEKDDKAEQPEANMSTCSTRGCNTQCKRNRLRRRRLQ